MAAQLTILPAPEQLHLIHFAATATEVTAVVETRAARTACPLCGRPASRVHSR